jgi:hypothetical protein
MKRHDIIGSKLAIRDADSIAYWRDSGDLCLISRSHRNGVSASMAPDQVAGSNGAAMSRCIHGIAPAQHPGRGLDGS